MGNDRIGQNLKYISTQYINLHFDCIFQFQHGRGHVGTRITSLDLDSASQFHTFSDFCCILTASMPIPNWFIPRPLHPMSTYEVGLVYEDENIWGDINWYPPNCAADHSVPGHLSLYEAIRLLERGPTCEPRRMRVASLVAVMAPVDEEDENSDEAKAKPPGQPIPMPSPPSTSSGTPLETVEAQEPVDTVETQEPENMVETDVKRRRLGLNKQDPKSDK